MSNALHNPRRGGSAVEFALTLPVLTGLVVGMLDYGAFFVHETQVLAGVTNAVVAGAQYKPEDLSRPCTDCVGVAVAHAMIALENIGQVATADQLTPRIERVGGTCALVLDTTLEFEPVVGLVPMPHQFDVSAVAMLVYAEEC